MTKFQIMRIVGQHEKKDLHILLDSGSTHNFIDSRRARRMGCRVEPIPPIWVRVADGGRIKCDSMIKGPTWRMHGAEFQADVMLLPLSGSDMVLGVQWFSTLGPIIWNFQDMSMKFKHQGKRIKLRGAQPKGL